MRATAGQLGAAVLAAAISGGIALPCAAQQSTTPFQPLSPFGPGAARAGTPGTLASPNAGAGSSTFAPSVAQPAPAFPGSAALPPPATISATTSTTTSAVAATVPAPPTAFPSTDVMALSASYASSTATAPAPPTAYGSSGGVAVPNPAAGTLQATTGTIETGAASSAPDAGPRAPLNMAPAGIALNSDLDNVSIVAGYNPPSTQAMGAAPAAYAATRPGDTHIAILQPPTERRPAGLRSTLMGAGPAQPATQQRPPKADRN